MPPFSSSFDIIFCFGIAGVLWFVDSLDLRIL